MDQFDDDRFCCRGDRCGFSHSTTELFYHPDLFRKRLCHQSHKCPRAKFCAFAHSRCELLAPQFSEAAESQPPQEFILYEFKTQWCPVGGLHDWENCVYAHTYRDWRRTPRLGYSSRPCQQWSSSVASGAAKLAYSDRCPRGFACPYAHGAKEQLYHPHFYKTSPCSDKRCQRGTLCAFTHQNLDVRVGARPDGKAKHVKLPLRHADVLLQVYQPGHANPPKYHTLDDTVPNRASFKAARREAAFAEAQSALQQAQDHQAQQAHLPEWLRETPASDPYTMLAAMAALPCYPSGSEWLGEQQQWTPDTPLTLPSYISSVARRSLEPPRSEKLLGTGLAHVPREVRELGASQLKASAELAMSSALGYSDWSWSWTVQQSATAAKQPNSGAGWDGWQPMLVTVPIFAPATAAAWAAKATLEDWQYGAAQSPAQSLPKTMEAMAKPRAPVAEKRRTPKDQTLELLRTGLARGIQASHLGSPAESGTTTNVPSPRHEEEAGSNTVASSSDPGDAEPAAEAWVPEPVFAM